MVSNIFKFLKFLLKNKPITNKFHIILMSDVTISELLKKKICLYVRGDKRLSVIQLVKDIRKLPRVVKQSGGTNDRPVVFEMIANKIVMSYSPHKVPSPSPFANVQQEVKPIKMSAFADYKFDESIESIKFIEQTSIEERSFDIDAFIDGSGYDVKDTAQGGNGKVYILVKGDSSIVIKTVTNTYKIDQMIQSTSDFKTRIGIRKTTCPGPIIPNCTINTLNDIQKCNSSNNWFYIQEIPAYTMPYYSTNLTAFIVNTIKQKREIGIISNIINATINLLPNAYKPPNEYSFAHCDIKLDNILVHPVISKMKHLCFKIKRPRLFSYVGSHSDLRSCQIAWSFEPHMLSHCAPQHISSCLNISVSQSFAICFFA